VDAVSAAWAEDGLDERLFLERFVPPGPPRADPASPPVGTVRFARSGREAPNDGTPLLFQAEAAGLTPQFGCRVGVCHTCACRKVEGTVRDIRNGNVCDAPDELIQICINVPVGDVTLAI
jgi:ferredoxin